MRRRINAVCMIAIATVGLDAEAAEVCGNGIDDDSDGLVDDQCYPSLTTGQCENPLSCQDTGQVSPSTGSLRYELPTDVAPRVPYGPPIAFRRYFQSQRAPGVLAPAYRKALGDRWGHSYASWLDKDTAPDPDQIVLHLPRGQEALFKKSGTLGGFDNYNTFQSGFHFMYLRQRTTSPNEYQLRTLTGETLVYSSAGKLIEIWDTVGANNVPPTPNKVTLAYDGNGLLSTVTDASGKRRLLFGYQPVTNLMTSVAFQINTGSWATYHTTSYGYTATNLTTVTIGGQLAQTNSYDLSNNLTSIVDGNSKTLVSFAYETATTGKVVRVDTARGVVGYEFGSSRTNCSGKTVLFFHKANTTSCNTDADCGTGNLCGGKTGSGSTGQCFRGARCLTVSSPSEDVITTITAFAGGAESCDGACLDAIDHVWTTTGGALDLKAVKDPSNFYTTKEFDANGLPTKIVYGDTDSNPATGGTRVVFLSYDLTFPGRIKSVKRQSELDSDTCLGYQTGSPCTVTTSTYTADGKLDTVQQVINTFDGSGTTIPNTVSVTYTTDYSYDTKGRLTQIDGPLPGTDDLTQFEYWDAPTFPLKDGFLQNFKRKKDASTFLTQSSLDFDFWGNATSLSDVDGTISYQTFDAARGYLTQRCEQMAGQPDCTTNGPDLVTSYVRDSSLRLTQLTRPDGSCMHYEYDARGRLSKVKRRDDCNAASAGDTEEFTYSDDGLVSKTEYKDASGAVTKRQELTYLDSRRLEKIINPVNTAKWTGLTYEARGLLDNITALDGGSNLSKTQWTYNNEGRVATEKRYTAGTAFDTWSVLFDWLGAQRQVTDGDSKVITSKRDDLGRIVQLTGNDFRYNSGQSSILRVYDEANRLVTIKDAFGLSVVVTHSFTFDKLGRPLNDDYAGTCGGGGDIPITNVPDVERGYDCLTGEPGCGSGAPSCPAGTSCTNLKGRLAYVKVKLMCTAAAGPDEDYTLEQETWYGYDAAGRLTHEYIKDDNGRTAAHVYTWSKNGALLTTTLPSGAVLGATFGSGSHNSDKDRIAAVWRTSDTTPIVDNVLYEPFGPIKQYNQQNSPGTGQLRTRIAHNLAYRQTLNVVEKTDGTSVQSSVTLTEDNKGRIIARDYYPSDPTIAGRYDSNYKFDLSDRLLCEATTSGTCPTSGTALKNNHNASPPFTAAGDWKSLLRPIPGSTGFTHTIGLYSGTGYSTHWIYTVAQNTGSPTYGTTYHFRNEFANRSSDDNTTSLTHDARTYTYDSRKNVTNVRGERYAGGLPPWHFYNVGSAFDAKNRRVYKSFHDESTGKVAQWFFYYDALDRLAEVRYTPDSSVPATYSVFQLVWLENKLVLYWQTDYPSTTTSKRYVSTDETSRPVDMMSWPASGAATRVWTINPDAWGNDKLLVGAGVFQPIVFPGQYRDDETLALQNSTLPVLQHRPALILNGFRTYDPWLGAYLQIDPKVDVTWSSYVYTDSNPVGRIDPHGFEFCLPEEGCDDWSPTDTGGGGGGGGSCSGTCRTACSVYLGWLGGCDCDACNVTTEDQAECPEGSYGINRATGWSCQYPGGDCICVTGPNQTPYDPTTNNPPAPPPTNTNTQPNPLPPVSPIKLCHLPGIAIGVVAAAGMVKKCATLPVKGSDGKAHTPTSTHIAICRAIFAPIAGVVAGGLSGGFLCSNPTWN